MMFYFFFPFADLAGFAGAALMIIIASSKLNSAGTNFLGIL
jgi:hypothetical protein